MLSAIRQVGREGLRPGDYHPDQIETILADLQHHKTPAEINPGRRVDLDLLLTDAYLILGSHMLAGRVDLQTIDPQWHAKRIEGDLALTLEQALASNQIERTLKSLFPVHPVMSDCGTNWSTYRQ